MTRNAGPNVTRTTWRSEARGDYSATSRERAEHQIVIGVLDSPVVAVLPHSASADVNGATVALSGIEIRAAGGTGQLTFRSHASTQRASPCVFIPELSVVDDLGSAYDCAIASWDGNDSAGRGELAFSPAPGPAVAALIVTAVRFNARWMRRPGRMMSLEAAPVGPWQFRVPLRAGSGS